MLQRRTPLPRSKKPLKRTRLSRKPGRTQKLRKKAIEEAKDFYFALFVNLEGKRAPCQKCAVMMWRDDCAGHHKIKRSQWAIRSFSVSYGIDDKKNLVIVHHHCHAKFHETSPEGLALLQQVCLSPANAENGERIK